MCDSGASINVLPWGIYNKLRGVEIAKTKVVIQLADRPCILPEEVLEDVMVKVNDFLYPADFYIIRISEPESSGSSGVLLGRPFFRTTRPIINVFDGTICLDFHGEKFTFSIDEAMRRPGDEENLNAVEVIAPLVQEFVEEELLKERAEQEEMESVIEDKIASWFEEIDSREMTDEELTEAIERFCERTQSSESSRKSEVKQEAKKKEMVKSVNTEEPKEGKDILLR